MLKKGGSSGGGISVNNNNNNNGSSEKSPPLSPKETSPRDSDSDEHSQQLGHLFELKTAVVHFRKLIAEQSELFTKEVKLQLVAELIEEFCSEASTKEECKQVLSVVKNVTHCATKLQKKVKREKRKNKQQARKGEKVDNNNVDNTDVPTGGERDEPARAHSSLSLGKKPSLIDMLEFLRSTSSTGNEGPSPSILSQFERKQRSDTHDSGSAQLPSPVQDSSLATVSKKNSSLIDLFEFRNEASGTETQPDEAAQPKDENRGTTVKDNERSTSDNPTTVVTRKLDTKRSEVDLFTFLSEMDDDDPDPEENSLPHILLKTSLQPTLLFNPNKMLLDVVIVEMADLKIKESK